MFRYERVNLIRKLIVKKIVSLKKKIYKRVGPLRAVFVVKTLAFLFLHYPRKMKTKTEKFKSVAVLSFACFYGNSAIYSHAPSIARAWLKHAHSFDRCGDPSHRPEGSWALGTRMSLSAIARWS